MSSSFSALLFPPTKLKSLHPRDRADAPLSRLRFQLDTMPGSRKYVFTPATRSEILSELYESFWGQHSSLFLPTGATSLPKHATLCEVQARAGMHRESSAPSSRPCGRIFKKGEACFRCKDCAVDDSCVMCSRCFGATSHATHNVICFIAQQSGGTCDCGDVEAWNEDPKCPYHIISSDNSKSVKDFINKTLSYPKATPKTIAGQEVPPVKDYPNRASIPSELHESMSRTVGYAIDYILDTLDYSPDETICPRDEAGLRAQPSADPMMMKEQYCIVIWNDDKHSFDEVTQLLVDCTGRTREEAMEVVSRIDENGRDVVDMNGNITRLLEVGHAISQIDLGITIRRAYDTFREQVSAVIIEWLLDLTRCRIGTDTVTMREIVAAELLSPRKHSTPHARVESELQDSARIDWMFIYHTKLWKRPRLNLKEIYASLLFLSHEHKLAVASHFANVYNRVIDLYLLVDREAETSVKYFTLQLFTIPSVALYVARQHNMIFRLLAVVTSFFTNQIEGRRITMPPDTSIQIDVETFPFKSKRFMPVFSDLRYLCSSEPVQKLIVHNTEFITQFSSTCQLFMCVNPNKRHAADHVEYETDAWISVFNVTLSLSRVIKTYGAAFTHATVAELVAAINTVIHNILVACVALDEARDPTRFPTISFHTVGFGNSDYHVVEFNVLEGPVSFHHSLQWLLSELLKHVDTLSEENLQQAGLQSLRDVCFRKASEQAIQTIVDYPLRVLAMVAQIRTGLWVRNGFAIRGQLIHYRDYMLRELCYDQDLFILQNALVILDPDKVFVSMLDRFQLVSYFSGAVLHDVYDDTQLGGMVEELLYVLTAILTETASATKMPMRALIRREVVHALAVGPASFTDLTKRVAERLPDDINFERVLRDVTNFKAPESTSDLGMYELKDESYDEVNPFFYHYTRNKREEVEAVLRSRAQKRGLEDPVIIPKPLNITFGPFITLPAVFESEVLLQILFYSLYNVLSVTDNSGNAPPAAEAILDQAIYLIMSALIERHELFSNLAVFKTFEEDKGLLSLLCTLEHHTTFSKAYKNRVGWVLSRIAECQPHAVQAHRYIPESSMGDDPDDVKKRAAKARQEAIMKQMKAQQMSFVDICEDFDDEGDDDMGDTPHSPVSFGTCIVCQEELNNNKPFGSLGFLQPSRVLRRFADNPSPGMMFELFTSPENLDRSGPPSAASVFPPLEAAKNKWDGSPNFDGFETAYNSKFGLHASICSHMMHLECFTVYSASIRQRHRVQATRNHPESIPRKEYICPLCKSLGNVILPVAQPPKDLTLNPVPFPDWIRAQGISILKSKSDPDLESLQFRSGTGEFVFWSAQDTDYQSYARIGDRSDPMEVHKMVDTVMVIAKIISAHSGHLRTTRPEPDPGERGAGLYLPEDLVAYTISCLEVAQRGIGLPGTTVADSLTESQIQMTRGIVSCLSKLVELSFKNRPDKGRAAVRQAIIKRLLPEWSRTTFTSFAYPLLLRDPFTVLVETAAVAPDILGHVLILTYYACLARTVIGLIYGLAKTRNTPSGPARRQYEGIFGDVRMFFMSVIRPAPALEHITDLLFGSFGEAKIEKMLYAFTLPFLRRAAILCRAVVPNAFHTPSDGDTMCEYRRLLKMLGIPPLSDLPNQDTLQNALSGWCSHYGHSPAASQISASIYLHFPTPYRLAKLPIVFDQLFLEQEKLLTCPNCKTVPQDAAICLICGITCCLQSHCCMEASPIVHRGECNIHQQTCMGPIGIYFLPKRCSVLYLYANSGTFSQSPYLDVHGELDINMRRGRRQYLHHTRWEDIRKLWLTHGIPTAIARKLESTVDQGGWETL